MIAINYFNHSKQIVVKNQFVKCSVRSIKIFNSFCPVVLELCEDIEMFYFEFLNGLNF